MRLIFESLKFERIGLFGFKQPLVRRLWLVILLFDLGTDSDFLDQFDGRLEVVLKKPQFARVEVIDGIYSFWGVIANITQDFSDMGVILLLDVGIVVFFVRPAAGELNLANLAVAEELLVYKGAVVVAVEAAQTERKFLFHRRRSLQDVVLAAA